jgi:hypothetical protein
MYGQSVVEIPTCRENSLASLKLEIISQRELAARLAREEGAGERAREARAKLFNLEDRLEVLEEMLQPFR